MPDQEIPFKRFTDHSARHFGEMWAHGDAKRAVQQQNPSCLPLHTRVVARLHISLRFVLTCTDLKSCTSGPASSTASLKSMSSW
jgi:hypothetical protein